MSLTSHLAHQLLLVVLYSLSAHQHLVEYLMGCSIQCQLYTDILHRNDAVELAKLIPEDTTGATTEGTTGSTEETTEITDNTSAVVILRPNVCSMQRNKVKIHIYIASSTVTS